MAVKAHFKDVTYGEPPVVLGNGATSTVYLGQWNGTQVAIKTFALQPSINENITKELEVVRNLSHHLIVQVYAVCDDLPRGLGSLAIIMEYALHGDLQKYLEAPRETDPVTYARCLRFGIDVSEAMRFCHSRGLIHRDLKSMNVCITEDLRAKVTDFGLSKFLDADTSMMSAIVGTPQYAAPETMDDEMSDGNSRSSCDVYSFGVILWEMMTRRRPWAGLRANQIIMAIAKGKTLPIPSDCSLKMQKMIAGCLMIDPAARPAFDEIHSSLRDLLLEEVTRLEKEEGRGKGKTPIVPFSFHCPITQEVMLDPVFTSDGHCYERSSIQHWLALHDTSPITNHQLDSKALIPAIAVKCAIAEWYEEHGISPPAPVAAPPVPPAPAPAPASAPAPAPASAPASAPAPAPAPEAAVSRPRGPPGPIAAPLAPSVSEWQPVVRRRNPLHQLRNVRSADELLDFDRASSAPLQELQPQPQLRPQQQQQQQEGQQGREPVAAQTPAQSTDRAAGGGGAGGGGGRKKPGTNNSHNNKNPQTKSPPPPPAPEVAPAPAPVTAASLQVRIFEAAASGQVELLTGLVAEAGGDAAMINWSNPSKLKNTGLHMACANGHVDCVRALLAPAPPSVSSPAGRGVRMDVNKANKSGATPLMEACRSGSIEIVQMLLDVDGVALNKEDNFDQSALIHAAVAGHRDIVKVLLVNGCDWTTFQAAVFGEIAHLVHEVQGEVLRQAHPDEKGQALARASPGRLLLEACRNNDIETARALAATWREHAEVVNYADEAHFGDDGEWIGSAGYTALLCACQKNHVACVELLLSCPAIDANQAAENGDTPLACACYYGHTDVVALIFRLSDHILANKTNSLGWTPLNYASRWGHLGCVNLLLSRPDTDANLAEASGFTPLALASFHGHLDCVRALLKQPHIDVNQQSSNGLTPLICASGKGHAEIVRVLAVAPGIELNRANAAGITAWFWASAEIRKILTDAQSLQHDSPAAEEQAGRELKRAASSGAEEMVRELADKWKERDGVLNWAEPQTGDTALVAACWQGREAIAGLLLRQALVDVNKANLEGISPIIAACANGHAALVRLLVGDPRVDVNKAGVCEQTPLHYAVYGDHVECAAALLGCATTDSSKRSSNGATPSDLATSDAMTALFNAHR